MAGISGDLDIVGARNFFVRGKLIIAFGDAFPKMVLRRTFVVILQWRRLEEQLLKWCHFLRQKEISCWNVVANDTSCGIHLPCTFLHRLHQLNWRQSWHPILQSLMQQLSRKLILYCLLFPFECIFALAKILIRRFPNSFAWELMFELICLPIFSLSSLINKLQSWVMNGVLLYLVGAYTCCCQWSLTT